MSKAVKKVVGVVAAVAIPFVAPAIATSIGLSSAIGSAVGSATAGSVVGGALTGAALGAAKGAVLGEDVGRSALMGGLGGGISGYMAAPTQTTAGVGSTVGNTSGTGLSGATNSFSFGPVDYSLASGAQSPTLGLNPPTGYSLAPGAPSLTTGLNLAAMDAGISNALATGTPVDYSLAAYTSPSLGLQATSASPLMGGTTSAAASPKTFMEALKQVPTEIAAKFSDPKMLADLTLRAAGQLAGSAIAGDGLSAEERRLLNAQTEELRMLQQTNRELFNQRLEMAQRLIGESHYFDPEYSGLQSANRVRVAGARAKRAGLRGLEGPARQAEARRFDLATARDTGTAFDVGYGTGVQGRLQTIGAGLNAMPQGFPSSMGDYGNLRATYADAAKRARDRQEDIGALFGSLTGRSN